MDPKNRYALVIATSKYNDSSLKGLVAPAQDAQGLAEVLSAPDIGDFQVTTKVNIDCHLLNQEIDVFFSSRSPDDVLLLYFSCHGLKDEKGRLYFAAKDTNLKTLRSTAVPADFVNDIMISCRSKQQILILDCCYSGAFAKGLIKGQGEKAINTREIFHSDIPSGRIILTATDSVQYAFDGNEFEGGAARSIFTKVLIDGLKSGAADIDNDGWVTPEELYEYVFPKVRDQNQQQEPRFWALNIKGKIVIAKNPAFAVLGTEVESAQAPIPLPKNYLPPWINTTLLSGSTSAKLAAIGELGILSNKDSGSSSPSTEDEREIAVLAVNELQRIARDDIAPEIRAAAAAALNIKSQTPGGTSGENSDKDTANTPAAIFSQMLNEAAYISDVLASPINTPTIIADSIVEESLRHIQNGYSPLLLRHGLEDLVSIITEQIISTSSQVIAKDDMKKLAKYACRDEELADFLVNTFDKIGKGGYLVVDNEPGLLPLEAKYLNGYSIDCGYGSAYFVTDNVSSESRIAEPYVVLCDRKISAAQDIVPILEKIVAIGKREVVFVSKDVDGEALATLVLNKIRGMLNCLSVSLPIGNFDHVLEDIAAITGATIISEKNGRKLETATIQDLGKCKLIISSKSETTIIGGEGEENSIKKRINLIKESLKKGKSTFEIENINRQLNKMMFGGAIIVIGGSGNRHERLERINNARRAVAIIKSALEGGIVPGGGVALLNSISILENHTAQLRREKIASTILRSSLESPVRELSIKAGFDGESVLNEIRRLQKKTKNKNIGYDIYSEKYCDLVEVGVIEPTLLTCRSLEIGVELALQKLSTYVPAINSLINKSEHNALTILNPQKNEKSKQV